MADRSFSALGRFLRRFRPPEAAWLGAARGLWVLAAAVVLWSFFVWVGPPFGWHRLLAWSATVFALIGAGFGLAWAWRLSQALPPVFSRALLLVFPVCWMLVRPGLGTEGAAKMLGWLATGAVLLGGGWLAWRRRDERSTAYVGEGADAPGQALQGVTSHGKAALAVAALGFASLLALVAASVLPVRLGLEEERNAFLDDLEQRASAGARTVRPLDLDDPSLPGPYAVETLTYGSGTDRHRPEFGSQVDVRAPSVDGSKLLEGWDDDLAARLRTAFWGFDSRRLPLQARVFLPVGDGPFPLVLMVHGNHPMEDFSDGGYAYLGELLASRGAIFASVDQNFLNSSAANEVDPFGDGGLEEENDARGWLLLEHVRQWLAWNRQPGHRFHGRFDPRRVVLMGHSRGGEAVATAAVFEDLERYPDDATLEFDYGGFELRGVAAIAPIDGQYQPRSRPNELLDTNYFVLHGSLDGDVRSFMGMSVFERVRFSDTPSDHPRFAASLYLAGANHGQFNTDWGACDYGPAWCWLFDTRALLPAEDQRKVAQVYLGAFVEVTAHGRDEYRALFRDPRLGASWLPEVHAVANYTDDRRRILADYEEDVDPTTGSLPGSKLVGQHLSRWRETWPKKKWGRLGTHVAILAWDERALDDGEVASYALRLAEPVAASPGEALVFALADAGESTLPKNWSDDSEAAADEGEKNEEENEPEKEEDEPREDGTDRLLDWTVVLVDAEGTEARLPLSHDQVSTPRLDSRSVRLSWWSSSPSQELVLRRYSLPIADFAAAAPDFDPGRLIEVRFVLDRSPRGAIVLDALALDGADSASPRELEIESNLSKSQ